MRWFNKRVLRWSLRPIECFEPGGIHGRMPSQRSSKRIGIVAKVFRSHLGVLGVG